MLAALGIAFTYTVSPHPSLQIVAGKGKQAKVLHILDARSGHEARNLRGAGADHILIDEAAFVPESLIAEVAMPMLAANDGRMTLISTPRGRNFFYRLFLRGQNNEHGFWSRQSPSIENPRVAAEFLEIQKEIISDRAYLTEYEAQFIDSQTAVFAADAIDECLIAPMVEHGPVYLGVDWARYRDFVGVVAVRGDKLHSEVIRVDRWSGARWSHSVRRVAAIADEVGASVIACDSTGAGDAPTENLASTIKRRPVVNVQFTSQSKPILIESLGALIEHVRIRLSPEPALIAELENYEAKLGATGNTQYSAAPGFHDDLVCALALACSQLGYGEGIGIQSRGRNG